MQMAEYARLVRTAKARQYEPLVQTAKAEYERLVQTAKAEYERELGAAEGAGLGRVRAAAWLDDEQLAAECGYGRAGR